MTVDLWHTCSQLQLFEQNKEWPALLTSHLWPYAIQPKPLCSSTPHTTDPPSSPAVTNRNPAPHAVFLFTQILMPWIFSHSLMEMQYWSLILFHSLPLFFICRHEPWAKVTIIRNDLHGDPYHGDGQPSYPVTSQWLYRSQWKPSCPVNSFGICCSPP